MNAPYTPPTLPPVTDNTSMLYLWLTDYMANTAGFVYQTAGALHYIITPSMVPPSLPVQLNTSYFKAIVPQVTLLYKYFVCQFTLDFGLSLCDYTVYIVLM